MKVFCHTCNQDQDDSEICEDCGGYKYSYNSQYLRSGKTFVRYGFFRNLTHLNEIMNRWNSQDSWKYWRA